MVVSVIRRGAVQWLLQQSTVEQRRAVAVSAINSGAGKSSAASAINSGTEQSRGCFSNQQWSRTEQWLLQQSAVEQSRAVTASVLSSGAGQSSGCFSNQQWIRLEQWLLQQSAVEQDRAVAVSAVTRVRFQNLEVAAYVASIRNRTPGFCLIDVVFYHLL